VRSVRRKRAPRTREGEEWRCRSMATFPGDRRSNETSIFNSGGEGMAPWERGSPGEGEWSGNKWATGEASRGRRGLYTGSLAWGARCTRRTELDGEGGVS
jgi:hypothetical protein